MEIDVYYRTISPVITMFDRKKLKSISFYSLMLIACIAATGILPGGLSQVFAIGLPIIFAFIVARRFPRRPFMSAMLVGLPLAIIIAVAMYCLMVFEWCELQEVKAGGGLYSLMFVFGGTDPKDILKVMGYLSLPFIWFIVSGLVGASISLLTNRILPGKANAP